MAYPINPFPTPQPVRCDKPTEPQVPVPDQGDGEPDEPQEDNL